MTLLRLAYALGLLVGTRRALRARPLAPSAWTERDGRRERYALTPERLEALLAECEALRKRERELLELLTDKRLVEAGRRLRVASGTSGDRINEAAVRASMTAAMR